MKLMVTTVILLLFIIAASSNIRLHPPGADRAFIQSDTTPVRGKQGKKGNPQTPPKETDTLIIADSATIAEGLELIGSDDCATCHRIAGESIGPSYKEIADKYKSTQANIDLLAKRTITGNAGVWSQVPMTPHPALSVANAQKMMQCILSMK